MLNLVTLLTTKHGISPETEHGEHTFWQERGAEYVEKFFAGVARHTHQNTYDAYCLTDSPELLPLGVKPLFLPIGCGPGWWAKLALFKRGMLPRKRYTLYMDLDNVVCGDLTPLIALAELPNEILMCDDVIYPHMPNGSIILGRFDKLSYLWDDYQVDPAAVRGKYTVWPHAADQAFIADRIHVREGFPVPLLQPKLPPHFLMNARNELELGADYSHTSVVFGSAYPKPHESHHRFYTEHWKV